MQSCSFDVEKINIGKDQCHFCKMTIADANYGGAILTKKGKTYKFDDMFCIQSFLKSDFLDKKEIKTVYIQNYNGNSELLDIKRAYIIEGPNLNGPMNGKWIGFSSKEAYQPLDNEIHGKQVQASIFVE
jgi:copper chaperone NosL